MFKKSLLYGVVFFVVSGLGSSQALAATKYPASDFKPIVIYQNDVVKKKIILAQQRSPESSYSALELFLVVGFIGFFGFIFKSTRASTLSTGELTVIDDENLHVVEEIEEEVVRVSKVPIDVSLETVPVGATKQRRYGYQGK